MIVGGILVEGGGVEGFGIKDVLPMSIADFRHRGWVLSVGGSIWVFDRVTAFASARQLALELCG